MKRKKISIRFRQSAYRLLKNSKFKPAYVFAELIDNSIQSYLDNKSELEKIDKNYRLSVIISKKNNELIIVDNAAGISDSKMEKALEPGSLPDNREGLNEFGIGLKNAAVWMADFYTLKTSSIGEAYSKTVKFDYHDVVNNDVEEIDEDFKKEKISRSYTKITLSQLRVDEVKYDYDEIAKQIASIYRGMLMSGELSISFFGKDLSYTQPEFLKAPYYPDTKKYKKGELKTKPKSFEWCFSFDIPLNGKRMHGFVGILSKMQKNSNGISYCRRGRVIEGAGDEKMYPPSICSKEASSHQRKRMFGEFNFDNFEVSFDKGKLLAEEEITELIDLLSDQLKVFTPKGSTKTYNMLKQASELRVDEDVNEGDMILKLKQKHTKAERKKETIIKEEKKYEKILNRKLEKTVTKKVDKKVKIDPEKSIEKTIPGLNGEKFLLRYTIKNEDISDILYDIDIRDVKDRGEKDLLDKGIKKIIEGYINVGCPFLNRNDFLLKGKTFEAYTEFVEYLMISEAICEVKGLKKAHYLRDTINDLANI